MTREVETEETAALRAQVAELERLREEHDAEMEHHADRVIAERNAALAQVAMLREALTGLVDSATSEANEKGAGGFHLARVTDAVEALSSTVKADEWLAKMLRGAREAGERDVLTLMARSEGGPDFRHHCSGLDIAVEEHDASVRAAAREGERLEWTEALAVTLNFHTPDEMNPTAAIVNACLKKGTP